MLAQKLFSWCLHCPCAETVSEELNTLLCGFKSCSEIDDKFVIFLTTSFYF